MKQQRNVKNSLLRLSAVLLLVLGLILIFNKQLSVLLVQQNQQKILTTLNPETIAANQKKKAVFDFKKVKSIDLVQVAQSRVNNTANAIGLIAVPKVGLSLPILKGLSNDALSSGGGTMRANQVMGQGNYPLAGHYMTDKGALFSPLQQTQLGQRIYLTDLKRIYVYQITMKKIVDPTAVGLIANTKANLVTLITCADGGRNRWAIRGRLIQTLKATNRNLRVFK